MIKFLVVVKMYWTKFLYEFYSNSHSCILNFFCVSIIGFHHLLC